MRQARSFASLPELTNRTRSRPPGIVAARRSASSTTASCRYRVFVFSGAAWPAIASTTRGWACPTTGTLLYASRYRRPSAADHPDALAPHEVERRRYDSDSSALPRTRWRRASRSSDGPRGAISGSGNDRHNVVQTRRSRSSPSARAAPRRAWPSRGCSRSPGAEASAEAEMRIVCAMRPASRSPSRTPSAFPAAGRRYPGQECLGHLEQVGPATYERLERGGIREHERGVRHVAEVDDPADPGSGHREAGCRA